MNINYREALPNDVEGIFPLAAKLATRFQLHKEDFTKTYHEVMSSPNTDLLIAEDESKLIIGYVLGFHHSTFYANGVISWVEELFVLDEYRGMRIGKKLMSLFEQKANEHGSKLVALATRRAGLFYKAIGYDESAAYFKKSLENHAGAAR